jgi:hypothetical protein
MAPVSGALPLYGLTLNPYDDRVLDPIARAEDADLFAVIDGFRSLGEMHNFLEARSRAEGPTFVLIKGPDGSGRTSVANYVVSSWKVARPDEPHLLQPLAPVGETRSAREAIAEWLAYLRTEARKSGRVSLSDLDDDITSFYAISSDSIRFVADLRYLLSAIEVRALAAGYRLVALFDKPDVVDLVPVAVNAFAETRALVVFVAGDYPSQLEPLLGEGGLAALPAESSRIVQLDHLDVEEVAELVSYRWENAVKHSPTDGEPPQLPFDLATVASALAHGSAGPRTLKRILNILQSLLEMKEAELDGRKRPVAAKALRFGAEELTEKVRSLDELAT